MSQIKRRRVLIVAITCANTTRSVFFFPPVDDLGHMGKLNKEEITTLLIETGKEFFLCTSNDAMFAHE